MNGQPEALADVFYGAERLCIVIFAGLCLYWGYRLFYIAAIKQGEQSARSGKEFALNIRNVVPGICFALFGMAILTFGAWRGRDTDRASAPERQALAPPTPSTPAATGAPDMQTVTITPEVKAPAPPDNAPQPDSTDTETQPTRPASVHRSMGSASSAEEPSDPREAPVASMTHHSDIAATSTSPAPKLTPDLRFDMLGPHSAEPRPRHSSEHPVEPNNVETNPLGLPQ